MMLLVVMLLLLLLGLPGVPSLIVALLAWGEPGPYKVLMK